MTPLGEVRRPLTAAPAETRGDLGNGIVELLAESIADERVQDRIEETT